MTKSVDEDFTNTLERLYREKSAPKTPVSNTTAPRQREEKIDYDITNYDIHRDIERDLDKIRRQVRDSLPFYLQSHVSKLSEVIPAQQKKGFAYSAWVLKIGDIGFSVSYDTEKNKYRCQRTPKKQPMTDTVSVGEVGLKTIVTGYQTIPQKPVYYDTQKDMFVQLWQDIKYAKAALKADHQEEVKAGLSRFAKIFGALAVAGGVLYACSGEAAELDAQPYTHDTHEISIGLD